MSAFEFTKDNLKDIKGRQPSRWDSLLEHFTDPGDRIKFDPEKVSKIQATQGAARLRKLSGKPFHSGYDALEKVTFIRLRTPEEVDSDDSED